MNAHSRTQLCRLASSSFLHDSFAHLCTSSYALWTIAPQVESVLGSGTFLGVYYLSGLAGNVLSFVYGDAITVGASSATFGLIGALCCSHCLFRVWHMLPWSTVCRQANNAVPSRVREPPAWRLVLQPSAEPLVILQVPFLGQSKAVCMYNAWCSRVAEWGCCGAPWV